ncbi:hypothetical protein [Streptomyces sp. NBC_01803]|uniref:hypothetical protein n=1 Tax=Streptomyces sp. NBC_01803 TaxID=2975946 RepID=UPI002DDC38A4|nr:hypothetical protein [Streptomyces sp. NBC_01803]WSA46736.1 hypothetical protein OIE51_22660 [Streptomyces sp. NBC_01803]
MDVASAVALVSVAAGSAATEAGRQAWESLVALTRRLSGRGDPDPGDEAAVRELTVRVDEEAGADGEFASELVRWAEAHQGALVRQTRVENVISGNATVHGPVIQTHTIHGGLHFGGS